MTILCPFCKQEMEETEPEYSKNKEGKIIYTCYRKICRNEKEHFGNGNIVVPYNKEE